MVFLFLLINSFNKTEAAIYPMQAMLASDFPCPQIVKSGLQNLLQLMSCACVAALKILSVLHQ